MQPQRHLGARLVGMAGVCAVVLTGCLFTDQTAAGNALHKAPNRLAEAKSVSLSVAFSSEVLRAGALTSLPPPDPGVSFTGVMDLADGTASYTAKGATKPSIVFAANRVFALTPHANPLDARPWLSTTLNQHLQDFVIDPSSIPASFAAYALRPSLLLDMLSGALTGSVHNRGAETVDGVPTTRYDVRFDLAQAYDNATRWHYSQRQLDDIGKLLGVLGIHASDLDDGAVWLDANGDPRRIVVGLRESPVPKSLLIVLADVHFTPSNAPVSIAVPDENTVVTVPSLYQLLSPFKDALGSAA